MKNDMIRAIAQLAVRWNGSSSRAVGPASAEIGRSPRSRGTRVLALLFVGGVAAACTSTVSSNHTGEIDNPPPASIIVCHGYDCTYKDRMAVTAADARRYSQIMAAGRGSAAAERQAIAKAIVHFEERSAAMLGKRTTPMSQFKNSGVRGEMDCIDEATNSQSLMRYLESRRLLRHHKVGDNVSRGFMFDGQFPHAAASIEDRQGGQWAVDSWRLAVGEPPEIMPLGEWRTSGNLAEEMAVALQ